MDKGKNNKIVVGQRQILRELKRNNVARVQIARDAEKQYIKELSSTLQSKGVIVEIVGTMHEIANRYGIDVQSGAVGFLKSPLD